MSVTFSHTAEPIISGWFLECGCGQWTGVGEFASYDEAAAELKDGGANGCEDEDCRIYKTFIRPRYVGVEPISANFSNVNARHILSLLNVHDEDLCGSMSVEDFMLAMVLAVPTAGVPTKTTVRVGGENVTVEGHVADVSAVRMIDFGRDAQYDTRELDALREVVAQALEMHAEHITWG